MRGMVVAAFVVLVSFSGCTSNEQDASERGPTLEVQVSPANTVTSDPPEASPGPEGPGGKTSWSLPPMRVGDVVAYEMPTDDGSYIWQYEVKDALVALDRDGIAHGAFKVTATRPSESTSSDPTYEGVRISTWRYDATAGFMVTSGDGHRSTGEGLGINENWGDQIHDQTSRFHEMALCGIFNALQGKEVANSGEIFLLGNHACVSAAGGHDGAEYPFQWTERGVIQGRTVDWFHDVTRRDDHLGLAFDSGVPYPVAVAYRNQAAIMVDFKRGDGPDQAPSPTGSMEIPAYRMVQRGTAGPDDSKASIPFTLDEAFAAAMQSTSFTDVQEFMDAHPEARAFQASSQAMRQASGFPLQDGGTTRLIWSVTLVAASDTLHFCVERNPTEEATPAVGDLLGTNGYRFDVGHEGCGYGQGGEIPPVSALPEMMADVIPLLSIWPSYQRMEWPDGGPDHWGYSYSCLEVGCSDPALTIWVGNSWSWDDTDGHHWLVDRLSFDEGIPSWTSGLNWVN